MEEIADIAESAAQKATDVRRSDRPYIRVYFCQEMSTPCPGAKVCTRSPIAIDLIISANLVMLLRLSPELKTIVDTPPSLLMVYDPSILAFRYCRKSLCHSQDPASRHHKSQYRAFDKPFERRYLRLKKGHAKAYFVQKRLESKTIIVHFSRTRNHFFTPISENDLQLAASGLKRFKHIKDG